MFDVQVVLYGIPNCDQVKKARSWLADRGIQYLFHDYKKSGIDIEQIRRWQNGLGWETVLNRKGTTWRGLPDSDKAAVIDAGTAATIMRAHPSLIKRPILSANGQLHAGFSDSAYQLIFKG